MLVWWDMPQLVKFYARRFPPLEGAQYFEVPSELWNVAVDSLIAGWPKSDGEIVTCSELITPISAIIPSEYCVFSCGNCLYVAGKNEKLITVFLLEPETQVPVLPLGSYRPGEEVFVWNKYHNKRHPIEKCGRLVTIFAYLVALINEPRIVARHPGGTRQQRRAAHRGMGFAVDAWTRVSWDLSKETVAKINRDPTFHKVPLHFRRGHFRQAMPHYKGAIQRPDAIRPEDRDLWWQWIEGQWVGHPAFGIKRSVHAPRLSTGELARRRSA